MQTTADAAVAVLQDKLDEHPSAERWALGKHKGGNSYPQVHKWEKGSQPSGDEVYLFASDQGPGKYRLQIYNSTGGAYAGSATFEVPKTDEAGTTTSRTKPTDPVAALVAFGERAMAANERANAQMVAMAREHTKLATGVVTDVRTLATDAIAAWADEVEENADLRAEAASEGGALEAVAEGLIELGKDNPEAVEAIGGAAGAVVEGLGGFVLRILGLHRVTPGGSTD